MSTKSVVALHACSCKKKASWTRTVNWYFLLL